MEVYTTGHKQTLEVHDRNFECDKYGCVIHNPTDPHPEWPTLWRGDRRIMERVCPHGVGHPDKDSIEFIRRTWGEEKANEAGIHGCDGCCS